MKIMASWLGSPTRAPSANEQVQNRFIRFGTASGWQSLLIGGERNVTAGGPRAGQGRAEQGFERGCEMCVLCRPRAGMSFR
jgi:hypothetical protein